MDGTQSNTATTQSTENQQQTSNATSDSQQKPQSSSVEEMIQRAVDRATQRLGTENKKLRGEIDTLKKANMDADERKQFELSEKEKEIADREKALTEKTNRLFAIKAIEETGLRDGKGSSSALVDFVIADTEEAITERVKAFNALVESIVKTRVDSIFKTNGRTPGVGSDGAKSSASDDKDSFAVRMGKSAAQTNQQAQNVRDHYIGGRKR